MKKHEQIKNVMTKTLETVDTKAKFSQVKEKMHKHKIHHLPVVENNKLLGIISRYDVMSFSYTKAHHIDERAESSELDHVLNIEEMMTKEVCTLKETDTVKKAVQVLVEHSFNSLPVVNDADELVGIVTSKDLLKYLLEQY